MSKEMTPEEAKKILADAKAHELMDSSDGSVMSGGGGPSFQEIAKATEVLKQAELEAMTLKEAKKILSQIDPQKRIVDDDGKILQARKVMDRAWEEEKEKLRSGEIRPNETEVLSREEAYETLRFNAAVERRKPLFKRLFSKKEKPFYWENPLEWQDVKFQTQGEVLFSHRIDLEYLTPDQEKQVREGLKKRNIRFEERNASATDGAIRKGDRTLRISDKKSIEQLRSMVFHWATSRYSKPVSMTVAEYNLMQENLAERKQPVLPPQKAPVLPPEPERPFDWQDPMCWQDVKFQSKGEVFFSHRIRLEGLKPEQEKEVKEGLQKFHINFEERHASGDDGKIKKGDRTLRISDKESIEQLRAMVFHWAYQGRPASMPIEAYNKQQELLMQGAAAKSSGRK